MRNIRSTQIDRLIRTYLLEYLSFQRPSPVSGHYRSVTRQQESGKLSSDPSRVILKEELSR